MSPLTTRHGLFELLTLPLPSTFPFPHPLIVAFPSMAPYWYCQNRGPRSPGLEVGGWEGHLKEAPAFLAVWGALRGMTPSSCEHQSHPPSFLSEQTDRDGADCTGGPAGGLFGSTGSLAGWSMVVTAQAHLWRNCPAGCLHYPFAARDKAGTAARDHPGRGEEGVCAQNCLWI